MRGWFCFLASATTIRHRLVVLVVSVRWGLIVVRFIPVFLVGWAGRGGGGGCWFMLLKNKKLSWR